MANEKRLIDINEFPLLPMRLDGDMSEYERGYLDAQANMNMLPTVDAVEVVHGRWVTQSRPAEKESQGDNLYTVIKNCCSICYHESDTCWNYCPNCGAKMDGERKDNDF